VTHLALALELVELVSELPVPPEVDVELLAVGAVLLLVEAPWALEWHAVTGSLGHAEHAVAALLLAAQEKAGFRLFFHSSLCVDDWCWRLM
jgi:hypothetical protein